jgi:hypothetical protein
MISRLRFPSWTTVTLDNVIFLDSGNQQIIDLLLILSIAFEFSLSLVGRWASVALACPLLASSPKEINIKVMCRKDGGEKY